MTSAKTNTRIRRVLLIASAFAWILIIFNPGNLLPMEHGSAGRPGMSRVSFRMLLVMNPVVSTIANWGVMVVAMMFPLLMAPVSYMYRCSLKRRRFRAASLFVLAYTGTWIAAGLAMLPAMVALKLLLPQPWLPALTVGIATLVWQWSPLRQQCLNRGHEYRPLTAFGRAADRDASLFGVSHAAWCVGSGWAIMLFPMTLPTGHIPAMILVTFLMASEHLEAPRVPRWRLSARRKLMRLLFAQSEIRLKQSLGK